MEVSDSLYITVICGLLRLFSSLFSFFAFGLCRKRRSHVPAFRHLQHFFLSMGVWDFLKALFYLLPTNKWLHLFPALIYIATPFIGITFFYFAFTYTFPRNTRLKKYFRLLFLLPLGISLCVAIPPLRNHFMTFTNQMVFSPCRDYVREFHWGFYAYIIFAHLLTVTEAVFFVLRLKKRGLRNKIQSLVLLSTVILFLIQNLFHSLITQEHAPLFALATSIYSLVVCYWIFHTDQTEQTILLAQENLLTTIPFPIFMLNDQDRVFHANEAAQTLCKGLGHLLEEPRNKKDVLSQFSRQDIWTSGEHEERGQNVILLEEESGIPYYLYEQNFSVMKGDLVRGKLMMLFTVEDIQQFFDDLEEKAFRDALCGCYNRHFLIMKKRDFYKNEAAVSTFLPLTFIMGDLDRLKHVNDTYGHATGDDYISYCCTTIRENIRKTDYIFRLGGDEFLLILPRASASAAKSVISDIEREIGKNRKHLPFQPRLSMGSCTAESLPLDFDRCLRLADEAMYWNKQQNRQSANSQSG